jgi:hypothetical protein
MWENRIRSNSGNLPDNLQWCNDFRITLFLLAEGV